MNTFYPCLWFDGKAEEAATFYASLLPNSHVDRVWRSPADTPSGPAGTVLTVDFTLVGSRSWGSTADLTSGSTRRSPSSSSATARPRWTGCGTL